MSINIQSIAIGYSQAWVCAEEDRGRERKICRQHWKSYTGLLFLKATGGKGSQCFVLQIRCMTHLPFDLFQEQVKHCCSSVQSFLFRHCCQLLFAGSRDYYCPLKTWSAFFLFEKYCFVFLTCLCSLLILYTLKKRRKKHTLKSNNTMKHKITQLSWEKNVNPHNFILFSNMCEIVTANILTFSH